MTPSSDQPGAAPATPGDAGVGARPDRPAQRRVVSLVAAGVVFAGLTSLAAALLVSIYTRKQEARAPYFRVVEVTEETIDPAVWGRNWPSQYDSYKRTVDSERTRYGGSDAIPKQKLDEHPWLRTMWAGYAFSLDYREARGHAYMLLDQEQTRRVLERPQPGACLHCHSSVLPLYRHLGEGDVQAGFEIACGLSYQEARNLTDAHGQLLVQHPAGCIDCHDPSTMAVRVTRPGFINAMRELKKLEGFSAYDVNRDASRQEMRTFACAQCHVEYYFQPDTKAVTYPWAKGLKIENAEAYYDEIGFSDWTHAITGAKVLKAQHPEFEMWSQGIHARAGVSCADCHMPYQREGAMKVSSHHVRSPLLNIAASCQTCHNVPEEELMARVHTIQDRTHELIERAGAALEDMVRTIAAAKEAGATDEALAEAFRLQRRAQFRLDYVFSENSVGFHAPQEAAKILAESMDFARQAELAAMRAATPGLPTPTIPENLIEGVTPTDEGPPGAYQKRVAPGGAGD